MTPQTPLTGQCPEGKTKNSLLLPIILTLLIAILSLSTAYLAYQVNSLKQQLQTTSTPPSES